MGAGQCTTPQKTDCSKGLCLGEEEQNHGNGTDQLDGGAEAPANDTTQRRPPGRPPRAMANVLGQQNARAVTDDRSEYRQW